MQRVESAQYRTAAGVERPIEFFRKKGARRYILRVTAQGVLRITMPWYGSKKEALSFVERSRDWIESQFAKVQHQPWGNGTRFYYRGELVKLQVREIGEGCELSFGEARVRLETRLAGYKQVIEKFLWNLAKKELPRRTQELAREFELQVNRITVRNQRSRWGSCSLARNIALNWRLIQTPDLVRDYIIVHELMHLREMNHSARFWSHVGAAFPKYREAERWLKEFGREMRVD